jgi:hypothetical protein
MVNRRTIAMTCAACVLAACSGGGSKASSPTTTTTRVVVTAPPTTRVPSLCATDARLVVDYILGGELHGKLPLGGVVPAAEFAKPQFRKLLSTSLNACASQAEWHTAMQDYVGGGASEMMLVFLRGCEFERAATACQAKSS